MLKLLVQVTVADVLNTCFSNIQRNLNLPECTISNLIIKAIVKYQDHPGINAIERVPKSKDLFKFSSVEKKEIFQETVCLGAFKPCQDTDVPTKTFKENSDIFTDFVHLSRHFSINNGDFT